MVPRQQAVTPTGWVRYKSTTFANQKSLCHKLPPQYEYNWIGWKAYGQFDIVNSGTLSGRNCHTTSRPGSPKKLPLPNAALTTNQQITIAQFSQSCCICSSFLWWRSDSLCYSVRPAAPRLDCSPPILRRKNFNRPYRRAQLHDFYLTIDHWLR